MWRYLKAAFWLNAPLPGVGPLPLNALAVAGFAILGFAQPAFWLLGAGLETLWLFSLSTSARFRRVVDAEALTGQARTAESRRDDLLAALGGAARGRHDRLLATATRAERLLTDGHASEIAIDESRRSLDRIAWIHLRLLVAQQRLTEQAASEPADLDQRIAGLERELADAALGATLRDSKAATLELLLRRRDNRTRRGQSTAEIEADLARIEAQVDLAAENAALDGRPAAVHLDLDLAGNGLSGDLFGTSAPAVAELDRLYGAGTAPSRPRMTAAN